MSLFAPTVPLFFHETAMAVERARYASLLEKYHALKLAGAVEMPSAQPPGASEYYRPRQEPDEMRDLIDARAGSNLQMRKMMLRQLAMDRADHLSDDAIRAAIENGVSGNGVPA